MCDLPLTIEHDPRQNLFVVAADGPTELSAGAFLCETVERLFGASHDDPAPLYEAIDLDALDRLLSSAEPMVTVRFTYREALVTMLGPHRLHCQVVGTVPDGLVTG